MSGELKLVDRWVLFADILGFRRVIREIEEGDLQRAERINRALGSLASMQYQYETAPGSTEFTAFSDSIVVSDYDPVSVLARARRLSHFLAEQGLFLRGGIARGLLHHSGGVVFGPALVRAYELERGVAKVPRIVVGDEVADWLEAQARDDVRRWADQVLRTDSDGFQYVHPFTTGPLDPEGKEHVDLWLGWVRPHIVRELQQARCANRVDLLSKYRWLARVFDETVASEDTTETREVAPIGSTDDV